MEPKTGQESIQQQLADLRTSSRAIQASALVRTDGFLIASDLPPEKQDSVAMRSAVLVSMCDLLSGELRHGALNEIIVQSENGCLFLTPAGEQMLLGVLAQKRVNRQRVLNEVKRTAQRIAALVEWFCILESNGV